MNINHFAEVDGGNAYPLKVNNLPFFLEPFPNDYTVYKTAPADQGLSNVYLS